VRSETLNSFTVCPHESVEAVRTPSRRLLKQIYNYIIMNIGSFRDIESFYACSIFSICELVVSINHVDSEMLGVVLVHFLDEFF
jgi:hypothetical protein